MLMDDIIKHQIKRCAEAAQIEQDSAKQYPFEFFDAVCYYDDMRTLGISTTAISLLQVALTETDDLENKLAETIERKHREGLSEQDIYELIGREIIEAFGEACERFR